MADAAGAEKAAAPGEENKGDPNNPDGIKKEQLKKTLSERVKDFCSVISP